MNRAGIATKRAVAAWQGLSGVRVRLNRCGEAEGVDRYPLQPITCDTCGAAGWQGIDQRITWREEHA